MRTRDDAEDRPHGPIAACELSVVIPVYGSEACLADTLDELCDALTPHEDFEVVLINDASPDGVQRVIDARTASDPRIRCVRLARNLGQHRAILRGFAETRGDVVVTIDDDGQNPPSAVLAVARALRKGDLDAVYGHFRQSEHGGIRRLASSVNRLVSRVSIGNRARIQITNVRALRGDFARWLVRSGGSYPYLDALIFSATSRLGETPVEHRERASGESTYSLWKLIDLWISHLTTLSLLPLRIAMLGSFGVSIAGFVLGVGQILRVLIERRAPDGWLSLFTAMAFFFSVLFLFLGILSAYVGRMYVRANEPDALWERPPAAREDV